MKSLLVYVSLEPNEFQKKVSETDTAHQFSKEKWDRWSSYKEICVTVPADYCFVQGTDKHCGIKRQTDLKIRESQAHLVTDFPLGATVTRGTKETKNI